MNKWTLSKPKTLALTTTATSHPTGSSGSNKNVVYYNPVNITSESCVMIGISKNLIANLHWICQTKKEKNGSNTRILGKRVFSGHAQVVYCQVVVFCAYTPFIFYVRFRFCGLLNRIIYPRWWVGIMGIESYL